MSYRDLLKKKIQPDFEGLKKNILRQGTPDRVYYMELYQDKEIKDLVVEYYELEKQLNPGEKDYAFKKEILIQKFLGYDIVSGTLEPQMGYPNHIVYPTAKDTTSAESQSKGDRTWLNEHEGPIKCWEDFELYQWPDINQVDFSSLDWANKNLDEGMKLYMPAKAVFELGVALMGFEPLCLMMYEQPDLVDAVFQKIGESRLALAKTYCDYDCIGMLFGGDDMGYKTDLMVSDKFLKTRVLPWYRKMTEYAHAKDKLVVLHSCGKIEKIMDALIDEVHLDGRHSFEDVATPVTQAKQMYGDRIALIGGIDMDYICRSSESEIRQRVRDTLDVCMPGGGYCLGTGNTVANYIPVENYLVMLDEGRNYTA